MRADLSEPRAAVDWAVAQLETLGARIGAWLQSRPYEITTDFDPERGKNVIRYRIKTPPLILNAEAGAITNSIRTGLDLLASALAKCNGFPDPKDVYFPISASAAEFKNSGSKKIKRLSAGDQAIIEALAPYQGGNDLLFAFHQMDIIRKHRALLTVYRDRHFLLSGTGLDAIFADELPPPERPKDKSILARTNPSTTDCQIELAIEVTLAGAEPLSAKPVVPALREFASLVYSVIARFE